jgi:TonB family protein
MKNLLVFALFFSMCVIVEAQESTTKYCRDLSCKQEVPEAKAKYSRTITKENGVETTTLTNLKKNRVESQTAYKGKEPVGTWVILTGRGPEERSYDARLVYANKNCSNTDAALDDLKPFENNAALNYVAPVVDYKTPDIMTYLVHKLRYPANARRNGIQGTVHLAFTITAEGKIENIVVTKGVDVELDKEAVSLFSALKLSSPPKVNGQPQALCTTFPLKFLLR